MLCPWRIEGHAREQALLLPASVEDYLAVGSPVRFIDAFVDDLDLGEAGFHRSRPKATGRPGYDLGDMLKLTCMAISIGCGRAVGWRQRRHATSR
jgi:transposase